MTKIIFIEGVSGVGKSTMVGKLIEDLRREGHTAKGYVEFDYTNPIDFYCTAYFTAEEYENLCRKYEADIDNIHRNVVCAGKARLIRYFDEDTPLFNEPILSELMSREFCYEPCNPVSLNDYTEAYAAVWENFALGLDNSFEFIIFDGSLLHHPLNDMMRNYNASAGQAVNHIQKLLSALGETERSIFYLKTDDIKGQLTKAHIERGQGIPDIAQIEFWEKRYINDMIVLDNIDEDYRIFDVTEKWDSVRENILEIIL